MADGDPASDVLAAQPLFLPADAGLPGDAAARLTALVGAAQRAGLPLRVAVIASRADLGSVTALWQRPQAYARFLGLELGRRGREVLLVVMPAGYGVSGGAPLAGLPPPGRSVGSAAETAIHRLAAAAGVKLIAPRAPVAPTGGSDLIAWAVWLLGGLLIAAAWTASLRARPFRLRDSGAAR